MTGRPIIADDRRTTYQGGGKLDAKSSPQASLSMTGDRLTRAGASPALVKKSGNSGACPRPGKSVV